MQQKNDLERKKIRRFSSIMHGREAALKIYCINYKSNLNQYVKKYISKHKKNNGNQNFEEEEYLKGNKKIQEIN